MAGFASPAVITVWSAYILPGGWFEVVKSNCVSHSARESLVIKPIKDCHNNELLFDVKSIFEPMYLSPKNDTIVRNKIQRVNKGAMTNEAGSILIVTRSERLREAIRALLTSIPYLNIVRSVDNISLALKATVEHSPGLVLLDASLSDDEIRAMLRQIKTKWAETGCIVLANSAHQERVARGAGADAVVLNGRSTANLLATITKLLPTPESHLGQKITWTPSLAARLLDD